MQATLTIDGPAVLLRMQAAGVEQEFSAKLKADGSGLDDIRSSSSFTDDRAALPEPGVKIQALVLEKMADLGCDILSTLAYGMLELERHYGHGMRLLGAAEEVLAKVGAAKRADKPVESRAGVLDCAACPFKDACRVRQS